MGNCSSKIEPFHSSKYNIYIYIYIYILLIWMVGEGRLLYNHFKFVSE